MAEQKEPIWLSSVKRVTLGMDTYVCCPLCVFYEQRAPFLVHMFLSSAGMDGSAHVTLLGLKGWARPLDLP